MTASNLRLVDLMAFDALLQGSDYEWMKILRDARVVEIKPITYVELGKVYMVDLSKQGRFIGVPPLPEDEGRVAILCNHDDEPTVTKMIEEFRKVRL